MQNLFSPGDEVLVPLAGFFAQRLQAPGGRLRPDRAYDRATIGARGSTPPVVAAALAEHPGTKAVLLTQSETSTGVIQPIEAARRRSPERRGALVVVDVVSSLGAVPFDFDAWGIDVAVGGSQKALSASPGHRVRRHQRRAWAGRRDGHVPAFYFDWRDLPARSPTLPDPENPWTPAISVMQGLHAALELYFQDGVEAALARHRMLTPGGQGRRRGRSAWTCSARAWRTTGPSRRSARPRASTPTRSATGSAPTSAVCSRPGRAR